MATSANQRQVGCGGRGLFSSSQWQAVRDVLGLSPREFDIVQRLFDDMPENEIAGELSISPHTVHTYLKRLHRKLKVSNRNQLLIRVFAAHVELHDGFTSRAASNK